MSLTLRKFRKVLNLTQVEVAGILGCTQAAISKIDAKAIRINRMKKIASHVGAKATILIDIDGVTYEFDPLTT